MNRTISKKAAIILLAVLVFMQMFPAQSFAAEVAGELASEIASAAGENDAKSTGAAGENDAEIAGASAGENDAKSASAAGENALKVSNETESRALQGGTHVNYTDSDGNISSILRTKVQVLTAADAAITTLTDEGASEGWYAVEGDVTINNSANNSLTCSGNINLILLDGSSLTVKSTGGNAINVEKGNSLTITSGSSGDTLFVEGTGKLICKAWSDANDVSHAGSAGIGAGSMFSYTEFGDLVINGGVVEAEGADSGWPGPGIGSSALSNPQWAEVSGSVTINGGKVKAIAGQYIRPKTGGSPLGCSGICFGTVRTGTGLYINGGDVYVEGSADEPAVFGNSGCKYSIIGEKVGIIGTSMDETFYIDHTDESMSSELANYDTLHFVAGVNYTDADGKEHTLPGKKLTTESTTMDAADSYDGLFFVQKNDYCEINNSLVVKGDVKLVIADGAKLVVNGDSSNKAGIRVDSGNSLTIESGTLVANGNANCEGGGAGIGTNPSKPCGDITINKGNVTANGAVNAPGIGGSGGTNGKITIGGSATTVTATGGSNGTGIGGGRYAGGEIVINGGTVTANGNGNGAGIGGSADVNVTINGGTITANGDSSTASSGAGIGGSHNYGNGVITINGGNVTANGGKCAAGIGTGAGKQSTSNISGGTISINGGTVKATGGANDKFAGAGIGGGYKGDATEVVINDGRVTATGGNASSANIGGAGIGTGLYGKNYSIKINGGIINATGKNSSAIGKGSGNASGTVLVDANELIWASSCPVELDPEGKYEEGALKSADSRIVNDGEDLSGNDEDKLGGKAYAYANNTLKSLGVEAHADVDPAAVSVEDYAKIVENLDKITVTVIDRIGRQNFQLELLDRMLKEDFSDDEDRADYINGLLVNEENTVSMGVLVYINITDANLSGGDDAFIEYSLKPFARAKVVTAEGTSSAACELTIEDFENQPCVLEVTIPTCGSFVPGSVSHTSSDGKTTYETFTQDGSKKFSYDTETNTVTVSINHCSNLRINAKKSVDTGDITDLTMLPLLLTMLLMALLGTAVVLKRRRAGIRIK